MTAPDFREWEPRSTAASTLITRTHNFLSATERYHVDESLWARAVVEHTNPSVLRSENLLSIQTVIFHTFFFRSPTRTNDVDAVPDLRRCLFVYYHRADCWTI